MLMFKYFTLVLFKSLKQSHYGYPLNVTFYTHKDIMYSSELDFYHGILGFSFGPLNVFCKCEVESVTYRNSSAFILFHSWFYKQVVLPQALKQSSMVWFTHIHFRWIWFADFIAWWNYFADCVQVILCLLSFSF